MKVRDFSAWVTENDELVQGGQATGEGRIKDVERKMGKKVPGPLRELYRLHDGIEMTHGYIPPLQGESSLPEMIALLEPLGWDLDKWLPFFDYQDGNYDAVEVASKVGRVGRLDSSTGEMTEIAATFEDWLDMAISRTKAFERDVQAIEE